MAIVLFGGSSSLDPIVSTCTDPMIQVVQGYEFDTDLDFSDDAVYILAALCRVGVVYFQTDDGPTDTVDQLKKAAKEGYFEVIQHGYQVWVIESERFELQV